MSSPIRKVALAGASGQMGAPILRALLDADFEVTVLTRPSSKATFPSKVHVVPVDYESVESLTAALRGHDALISTVPAPALASQTKQIDAAIAAGVQRFIPSEFGCDLHNAQCATLPVFGHKIEVERYLEEKCPSTGTSYTLMFTNAFLDFGLDGGFFLDLKNKKISLYDGGDVKVTATPLEFIARGTVAVLQHPQETANRAVRLQGTAVTQRQLLGIAQKFLGKDGWEVTEEKSADVERQAMDNMKNDPQNVWGWVYGMLVRAVFGDGYSGDFTGRNDNDLLGLKELNEQDLEGYVKRCIDTGKAAAA